MNLREPYYTLAFTAGGCPWDIRVNDGPVLSDGEGRGTVSTEIPINRWLADGPNEISMRLKPGAGLPRGEVRLELFVREHALPKESKTSLFRLETKTPLPDVPQAEEPGSPDGGESGQEAALPITLQPESGGILLGRHEFTASMPAPPWSWMAQSPAPLSEADRTALAAEVRKFWEVLKSEDPKALLEALSARSSELQRAFYTSAEDFERELLGHFTFLWEEDDWQLKKLDLSDLDFRSFGGGRLYQPYDRVTNESVVYYVDQSDGEADYLEIIFARDGKGGWLIVR